MVSLWNSICTTIKEARVFAIKHISLNLVYGNIIETGILVAVSDIIAQKWLEQKEVIDFERTKRFVKTGVFIIGPLCSIWVQILDATIHPKNKTRTAVLKATSKKVMLDQLLFAPTMLAFVMYRLSRNDKNPADFAHRFQAYKDILKRNFQIWPCLQFINFYFVPLRGQVFVTQGFGVVWNTYLSWRANNL